MERPKAQRINVITYNVMLDKTLEARGCILSQDERIESAAATLKGFGASLDVVGVQEANKSKQRHNGMELAKLSGLNEGTWQAHNQPQINPTRGRKGEYMGMFGNLVEDVRTIELGDNRTALLCEIGGVAFLTYHLRAGASRWARTTRVEQTKKLLQALEPYDNAVTFGDDNELPFFGLHGSRDLFEADEFVSAFTLTDQQLPKTFPAAPYRMVRKLPKTNLDDIRVRGDRVTVLAAGVLRPVTLEPDDAGIYSNRITRAPSDHEALFATVELTYPQL